MKKLFLLDAMALIYRAHFAFSKNPRINSKGLNTGAVLGFTNSLCEILEKQKPSHVAVAFDTPEPTFRHITYKEYKANREEQPEDITTAIPYIFKVVEAFQIPILRLPGYEADDIIGTFAKRAKKNGFDETYMMTIDKDYAQLVEDKIFLYKPAYTGNGIDIWDTNTVLEKFDIQRVDQVIDFLGMQGDAVDNIPGIKGVGKKTAIKFLKEYGSMEGLYENVDKLKGKMKEKVENCKDQAFLSKQLATINIEVPLDFDESALKYEGFNSEKVLAIFEELEFKTLKKRLFPDLSKTDKQKKKTSKAGAGGQMGLFGNNDTVVDDTSVPSTTPEPTKSLRDTVHEYYKIDTPALRKKLVDLLSKQEEFCFDTETTSINAHTAELVGIAFSTYTKEAYYVPFPKAQKDALAIIEEFRGVFENEQIQKVGQNIKYDLTILQNYGIALKGKMFDTMLAHYLLFPDRKHNLSVLAQNYLNYEMQEIETLIGKKGKKQGSMRDVPVDKVVEYAGEDADITLQIKHKLAEALKSEKQEKLLTEIESPLIEVLATMESNGVRLDKQILKESSDGLNTEIKDLEDAIYGLAGTTFNIASPRQLGEILFDQLKISDKAKKTKTGQYATGEEILVKLAKEHDIVAKVLDYRELVKLKNTYLDALPALVNLNTGKIHTSYNQAVAATGRLSSTNPNLQNIPIRTERGRAVRKAFVASDENHILLAADYSQIELRLMAIFSQDETMLKAFQNADDIHKATASKIYKVTVDEVTADMRRKAKTANFGLIYGISIHGLSERLNVPRKEASELWHAYFEEFPAVKKYHEDVINQARHQGYTETLLGRKRYLRAINSRNTVERGHAERNAINTPIQGTAADIIKLAMIKLHQFFKEQQLKSKMILQVHDELVFDIHKDELAFVQPHIEELMKNALPNLEVPMEVEMGLGNNWLEAH